MARRGPPSEPLVVILGSTGTGKSDLAVELAVRFNGEIVNADAMQMYKGLPIITNKISEEEQKGVPHHLLGNIGLDEETWTVGVFKREASRKIRDIRARGRLPIVVGGTHYYTNGLLFENSLVDGSPPPDGESAELQDWGSKFPILDGPTEDMIAELRRVDPVMAERWHPNDRRKIRRSLEIYLTSGKRASDIYAEQRRQKDSRLSLSGPEGAQSPWQWLLLWVYTQPEVLRERLDRRVDRMLDNGLLDETAGVYEYLQAKIASGGQVDRTKGVWQSIGFKEFEPYLEHVAQGDDKRSGELEVLRQAGVADTKTATRQYAKYQMKWISKKTLPLLRDEQASDRLYLLDSTDMSRWNEDVLAMGADLTKKFLAGDPLPPASSISDTAKGVLSPLAGTSDQQETPCQKRCEVCNVTLMTEDQWERHVRGNRHRRVVRSAKRRALVPGGQQRPTRLAVVDQQNVPAEKGLDQDILSSGKVEEELMNG